MRGRSVVLIAILAALAGAALTVALRPSPPSGPSVRADEPRYHCPMHPTIVADHPGDCPICGMRLVPIARDPATHDTMQGHPAAPGAGPAHDGSAPPDRAMVRISTEKKQLIGVKTSPVTRARFDPTIRAVGRVVPDEKRLHQIHTKVAGFVERLHANATGEAVRRGQPLLEIYSPELLASQEEYLIALDARARLEGSSVASATRSADALVDSARRRLSLLDISDDQIDELERTRRARRTLTLYAPAGGIISSRFVTEGERVEPETNLLDLADLSRVWIVASVYEYELPYVAQGDRAAVTLSYLPGRTFEGRVDLVYPFLDPVTRTAQVRVVVDNPDLSLMPEMYAEVVFEDDLGERIAVPSSAVIETGTRSIVFVDLGDGYLAPREIVVGLRMPDLYEVADGLAEGESVVTSGNFLVDSESRLKAALESMAEGRPEPQHRHGDQQ